MIPSNKEAQKRVDFLLLCDTVKRMREDYANRAREWHRSADLSADFSPGLAAILRDIANGMQALSQRAADMAQQDSKP